VGKYRALQMSALKTHQAEKKDAYLKECGAWDNWGAGVILVDLLTQGSFRVGVERMWFSDVALRDLTMYKAIEEYVNIGKSEKPIEFLENRMNEIAADPRASDAAGSLTNGAA
jgi:hypothetical protein